MYVSGYIMYISQYVPFMYVRTLYHTLLPLTHFRAIENFLKHCFILRWWKLYQKVMFQCINGQNNLGYDIAIAALETLAFSHCKNWQSSSLGFAVWAALEMSGQIKSFMPGVEHHRDFLLLRACLIAWWEGEERSEKQGLPPRISPFESLKHWLEGATFTSRGLYR